jgi:hypothetical protein
MTSPGLWTPTEQDVYAKLTPVAHTLREQATAALGQDDGMRVAALVFDDLFDPAIRGSALRAAVLAIHFPARNRFGRAMEPDSMCPDCRGAVGRHPCGCWNDHGPIQPVCGHCVGEHQMKVTSIDWPCETALAVGANLAAWRASASGLSIEDPSWPRS